MSILDLLISDDSYTINTMTEKYNNAPYINHIYTSNLFNNEDTETILNEWPQITDKRWQSSKKMINNNVGNKLEIATLENMGQNTQTILKKLNSKEFINSLEKITGINNLKSDIDLYGGGLVYTPKGGFLKVHADFNYYDKIKMYRRLNLIIYMNKEWDTSWNGNIEFWNQDISEKLLSYPPNLNTFLLFRVHDTAYHGYPDSISCPDNMGRKSINIYYYTEENDTLQDKSPHKTLWKNKKGCESDNAINY